MNEELEEFKKFKKSYEFIQKEVVEKDGIKYCEGEPLINEEGKELGESESWINVGYKLKGPYAKTLSNLFRYKFTFRGKQMASIEGFFQGINYFVRFMGQSASAFSVSGRKISPRSRSPEPDRPRISPA